METNTTETGPAPDGRQGDAATEGPQVPGGSAPLGGRDTGPDEQADVTGSGFFPWLRRLGVPRRDGWLGGVCAGVAARLGIDPVIVRGIVIVAAVLGAPLVVVYAIAWLLLPDTTGRIHLERLLHGRVDTAVVGITIMAVIGLFTVGQGGWLFGWRWPDPSGFSDPIFGFNLGALLRVFWTLAIIGGLAWLTVWLIRRASRGGGARVEAPVVPPRASGTAAPDGSNTQPADRAAPNDEASAESAGPEASAPLAFAAAAAPATAAPAPAAAPAPPADGADAAALADWRAQHEAWRRSHAEWKSGQDEAMRAARAQAAAENKRRAAELTAAADAVRAARRRSRPRASAAYVFTLLGLALVAGAIGGLAAVSSASRPWAFAVAFASGALVLAAGMIVAALRRRRAGFLAFVTFVATVLSVGGSFAPDATFVPFTSYSFVGTRSGTYFLPFGNAYVNAGQQTISADGTPELDLTQLTGDLSITIEDGARVALVVDGGGSDVWVYREGGQSTTTMQVGSDGSPPVVLSAVGVRGGPADLVVRVHQKWRHSVFVEIREGQRP